MLFFVIFLSVYRYGHAENIKLFSNINFNVNNLNCDDCYKNTSLYNNFNGMDVGLGIQGPATNLSDNLKFNNSLSISYQGYQNSFAEYLTIGLFQEFQLVSAPQYLLSLEASPSIILSNEKTMKSNKIEFRFGIYGYYKISDNLSLGLGYTSNSFETESRSGAIKGFNLTSRYFF